MAKFRDFFGLGPTRAKPRAYAQLSAPSDPPLQDVGRPENDTWQPPAVAAPASTLTPAAGPTAPPTPLPPRPPPRPSFEDLWGDPDVVDTPAADVRPACPLPLPTQMGIYPDAQPHRNVLAPRGSPKPERVRALLLVGTAGERYLRGPRVAAGGFGKIYPVVREDGMVFAGKILRKAERQRISSVSNGQPLDKARRTSVSFPHFIDRERAMLRRVGAHVNILDEGEDMGRHFFIMPWMSASLRDLQRLVAGPDVCSSSQAGDLARRTLADGAAELAAAHALGVLHLDIKPDNFLARSRGELKLCDWGLARQLGSGELRVRSSDGTPAFQAPEIRTDMAAERASDVWSLAVTASVVATGKRPLSLYASEAGARDLRVADGIFAAWCIDVAGDLEPSAPGLTLLRRASVEPAFGADATARYLHELDVWAFEMARALGSADASFVIGDMMAVDPARRPTAAEVTRRFAPHRDEGSPAQSTMIALLARHRHDNGAHERAVAELRAQWAQHRRESVDRIGVA